MIIHQVTPVLNEADILPHVIRHQFSQGVSSIHIIDGWSTDGSAEIAEALGCTVERFPKDGPAKEQVCRSILHRIECLAEANKEADWILYSDADEFRRSSPHIAGETLAAGVARLDAQGFNAIDFRVLAFWPHDDLWAGEDPEQYFRWYNESDCICKLPNQKLWKNGKVPVTLAAGGHQAVFRGKVLAREKFVMKHIPFRNSQQAVAKLRTRIERRCHAEHKDGWGVHYDSYVGEFWKPKDLREWTER